MSTLPIFDQLYTGLSTVFGEPGFVFNALFLVMIIMLLLVGLDGGMVALIVEAALAILAVFGLATYGYFGYAIILSAVSMSIIVYRAIIK